MSSINFEEIATQHAELTEAARLDERRRIGVILVSAFGVTLDNAPNGVKKIFEEVIKEVFVLDEQTKAAIESDDDEAGIKAFTRIMDSLHIEREEVQKKSAEYLIKLMTADAVDRLRDVLNNMKSNDDS
jgi:hypothetical protein